MAKLGVKFTEEHKSKIGLANSISLKGKKHTKEHNIKIGESNKGKHKYWLGKKMSDEHKKKMSISGIGKHCGEKSGLWVNGRGYEPYTTDWTETLRESIRERYNFICQECGIHQEEIDRKLNVHHIDYDKKNCNPKNLISLCWDCHRKTNKNRGYWTDYFNNFIE